MKILLIDESEVIAVQLEQRLIAATAPTTGAQHIVVDLVTNYDLALSKLAEPDGFDAVVIEPYPLDQDPQVVQRIFRRLRESHVIAIAVTAAFTSERCVKTMREGARDFLIKSRPMNELVTAIISSILKELGSRDLPDLDALWVGRQLMRLSALYPGQWIAVAKRRLLAHAETHEELLVKIKAFPPQPPPKIWRLPVEWIDSDVF